MADRLASSDTKPRLRTCRLESAASKATTVGSQYAIVGSYAKTGNNFVKHAALLRSNGEVNPANPVDVLHMGPPIVAGDETAHRNSSSKQIQADVIGDLLLDQSECEAVADWLAGVEKEHRELRLKLFEQYKILPHVDRDISEEGRRGSRRFSCAGFVIEAYRAAEIELLDITQLPQAKESDLQHAYSSLIEIEKRPVEVQLKFGFKGRKDLGLSDEEGWPVALPGYLFHSTARASDESPRLGPYRPTGVHEACFPAGNAS